MFRFGVLFGSVCLLKRHLGLSSLPKHVLCLSRDAAKGETDQLGYSVCWVFSVLLLFFPFLPLSTLCRKGAFLDCCCLDLREHQTC